MTNKDSVADWSARIELLAHGGGVWTPADSGPWDGFYRDYRDATPETRQAIDQAFIACNASNDVEVIDAVINHCFAAPMDVAMLLFRLLDERRDFLGGHFAIGYDRPLLVKLLDAIAERTPHGSRLDLSTGRG